MNNENKENNQNMEQENKHNISCWKKLLGLKQIYKLFHSRQVFKLLLVIILIILITLIYTINQNNSVIFENKNIRIEYGPKRTINDYSYIIKLENGDTLLVGGYTYQDGSISGGKHAELYSVKENKFIKLPHTVNNFCSLEKTAINNNKVLLESEAKTEIYDINKRIFFQTDKQIFTDFFNKNNIKFMFNNTITINKIPYIIQNLDENYDLLIGDYDYNNLSCKLYDKQNNILITIPKLKYTPFPYSNENIIKIGNRKFLIPLNYKEYIILPTYDTLIITIKE